MGRAHHQVKTLILKQKCFVCGHGHQHGLHPGYLGLRDGGCFSVLEIHLGYIQVTGNVTTYENYSWYILGQILATVHG